ncbi:MAG: Hsp20/alpha crystallin family protein [Acidobacteria bacterium]|nr:Hsp20/alpha crystallin family protein [Acidobacteriota bacterium]
MTEKKQGLAPAGVFPDPFAALRKMTSELDRVFDDWPSFGWPSLRSVAGRPPAAWSPKIDVFEKNGRLVTKIDLPGVKKEDVSVEVADGQLALSGERKHEAEEKTDDFYRTEREYGSFYRRVPLPDGVNVDDVKATFADGVLEVSVPMPARAEARARKVQIEEPAKTARNAA